MYLKQSLENQRRINENRKKLREQKQRLEIDGDYEDRFWDFEEYLQEEEDTWCEDIPF